MVSLDCTKAFDKVSKFRLIKKIIDIKDMCNNDKRWLANYLSNSFAAVKFGNSKSRYRGLKNGVPQGGVLSPQLFNYYVADAPKPSPGVILLSYADDFAIACKDLSVPKAQRTLQTYMDELGSWFLSLDSALSPTKSTATLFTTDRHQFEMHPSITLYGQPLPLEKFPKVLGVKFDPLLAFSRHTSPKSTTRADRRAKWGKGYPVPHLAKTRKTYFMFTDSL